MKTADRKPTHETPEQVLTAAEAWYRGQVELCRKSLGTAWPEHKAWIVAYLREEVRLRLIARGWRPRDAR